jgi:hypothetical protein
MVQTTAFGGEATNFAIIFLPFLVGLLVLVVFPVLVLLYQRYLGVGFGAAVLWVLAALAGVGLCLAIPLMTRPEGWFRADFEHANMEHVLSWVIGALLPLFAVPLALRLYRAWVQGVLTEAERLTDMAGIRAWLRPGTLVCALGLALCACLGYDYSFGGVLALGLAAILAYPVINMLAPHAAAAPPAPAPPSESLAADRQRVLHLLEEGKINAEESTELLGALGESARLPTTPPAPAMTTGRKLLLVGAAVLLLSFFLPWLHIDVGAEVQHMRQQMLQALPGGSPMGMPEPAAPFGNAPAGGSVPVSFTYETILYGGDIGHGLGWIVLLLGLGAAVLPYVATTLSFHTLRTTTLLAVAAGTIIVAYLLAKYLRPGFVSIGLVLALIGYALEVLGAVQEYRGAGQPTVRPATA